MVDINYNNKIGTRCKRASEGSYTTRKDLCDNAVNIVNRISSLKLGDFVKEGGVLIVISSLMKFFFEDKLMLVLLTVIFYHEIQGQEFYVFLKNTENITPSCDANGHYVSSIIGSISFKDINGNNLTFKNGMEIRYNTRPETFRVDKGDCLWEEGPFSGQTFSAGEYTFTIPENSNYYYERRSSGSVIYFEKENIMPLELECYTTIINAPSVIKASDIVEWEYSFDGQIKSISASQSKKSIAIDINAFEVDFSLNTGKTIFFRYVLKGNAYSPFKGFTIVNCSPQLQEPIKTQKTTCNYKNDGMFTMNLDRDLNLGEELVVTLYDGNNDAILIGQNSTSNLVNNGVGYSFSWPSTLDSGSYRVKFQSHNGSGGIPDTDSSWNSLEFSDVFVVGQAVPVNFSITSSATESCFDSNDGYIELQGSRESDRSLFYQYSTNGGISYTNWLPFLNTNTTRISGLGKGNYRIKVRDSQNCMAKK